MNTFDSISAPRLIEPGVRYFLSGTLKECRKFKDLHTSIFFNIYMAGLFIIVIGGFLLYHYKGKLTPAELEIKNRKKHEYIISKLHQIAYVKKNQGMPEGMITGLPQW
jgi:hypothetical protein